MRDSALAAAVLLLVGCAGHRASVLDGSGTADRPAALRAEVVSQGPLEARVVRDDATLVVFYNGEFKGSMGDCGCARNPRGGLPRLKAYLDAERRANPGTPDLVLAGGYWLDDALDLSGELRGDARVMNSWMARGLVSAGFTALNASSSDLAGMAGLGRAAAELPMVSANVRLTNVGRSRGDVSEPRPWIVAQRAGIRVGVLGITARGTPTADSANLETVDPIAGAEEALEELSGQADVIVLLAFRALEQARDLAERHPEVDVVVDTFQHRETAEPFRVGNAVWVKAAWEAQRLGELRLWVEDGRVAAALDRQVDMDPEIPSDPALSSLLDQARREIHARQLEIFGP